MVTDNDTDLDITGIDHAELIVALYHGTRAYGIRGRESRRGTLG